MVASLDLRVEGREALCLFALGGGAGEFRGIGGGFVRGCSRCCCGCGFLTVGSGGFEAAFAASEAARGATAVLAVAPAVASHSLFFGERRQRLEARGLEASRLAEGALRDAQGLLIAEISIEPHESRAPGRRRPGGALAPLLLLLLLGVAGSPPASLLAAASSSSRCRSLFVSALRSLSLARAVLAARMLLKCARISLSDSIL